MELASELISEFAKITKDEPAANVGTTVYGTYRVEGESAYVQIDGSDTRTPVATTVSAKNGDRVTVLIKDHKAIVTGNLEDPSASSEEVTEVKKSIGSATLNIENLKQQLENQEITLDEYKEAIADAKRKATDYIDFSSGTGLVIGSSSISSNVRIYSGGIDIRDGSTILASYTDDTVSLGNNSSSSVIKMCGKKFQISSGLPWPIDTTLTETSLESTEGCLTISAGGTNYITILGNEDSSPGGGNIYSPGTLDIGGIRCDDITGTDGAIYINENNGYSYFAEKGHSHSSYYERGDNIYANKLYVQGAGTLSGDPNARLGVSSPYQLGYASGSSKNFKHDIKPVENEELNPEHLYDIEVVQFKYNEDYLDKGDQRYLIDCIGFIAEQVNEVYPIAADRETGEPRNWEMRYMIPPMLALIQEHKKEIDSLKQQIKDLEGKEVAQ